MVEDRGKGHIDGYFLEIVPEWPRTEKEKPPWRLFVVAADEDLDTLRGAERMAHTLDSHFRSSTKKQDPQLRSRFDFVMTLVKEQSQVLAHELKEIYSRLENDVYYTRRHMEHYRDENERLREEARDARD